MLSGISNLTVIAVRSVTHYDLIHSLYGSKNLPYLPVVGWKRYDDRGNMFLPSSEHNSSGDQRSKKLVWLVAGLYGH